MGWVRNSVYEYYVPYAGEYEIRQMFPGIWEIRSINFKEKATRRAVEFLLFRARAELKKIIYTDLHESEAIMERKIVKLKQEVIDQSEASFSDLSKQDGLGEKQQELRRLEDNQEGIRGHMANLWIHGVPQYEATKL